jgi:hypothetical protein
MHGSFANSTGDWRVTLNMGFHRRKSVLGVSGRHAHGEAAYDAERIRKRSEIIGYAIDARRRHFPDEAPFVYRPHLRNGESYRWDNAARAEISGYYVRDLNI